MTEMFDELVETKISGDGKVTLKRLVADEEMEKASEALVAAERKFEKIDRIAKAQREVPDNLCEWFDALEERYQAEKRLWGLFTAGDRSPRTGRMYLQFREALLSGRSTRADA